MLALDHLSNPSWKVFLTELISSDEGRSIEARLASDVRANRVVYPPEQSIFAAFNLTPLHKVRVVVLGQDPYHGDGQAMGLSFSVPKGTKIPPSLRNILKEVATDIGETVIKGGDLTPWASQGVFLLNAVLTVEKGQPGAHAKIGWEALTDRVIKHISDQKNGVVFLLWGAFAGSKRPFIDEKKHLVLTSPHPSPLAAHRGFFGCSHFSQVNAYLESKGEDPIRW